MSRDAPCAASHGTSSPPARRVSSDTAIGVEVPLDARLVCASTLLSPGLLRGLRIQERLARSGRLLPAPLLPRLGLPAHHCMLCEVMSRESFQRPPPVLDATSLPGLLAEKHGRIVEPAPGWLALMTGLIGRTLAPLPVSGLAVESVVGGSRCDLLPPVHGLSMTDRSLRTATGLATFTPVRGPTVTGRGLLTAAGLVGIALAVTGLGFLTAAGLGASDCFPMVARGFVMTGPGHAVPIADPVTSPFFPLTARSHGEEAGDPGVCCGSVWRLLLSPRLLLSLMRRQQWLLL